MKQYDKLNTPKSLPVYTDQLAVIDINAGMIESAEFVENPVYQNALTFVLVSRGEVRVSIDFVPYRLQANSGMVVQRNHTYDQLHFSSDFKGTLVIANLDYILSTLHVEDRPTVEEMMAIHYSTVHQFDEEDLFIVWEIIGRLRHNMSRTEHRYHKSLVRNEFSNLLLELWELGRPENTKGKEVFRDDYHNELAARFLDLLLNHCREEHELTFYAEELCVTPVYLSRTMKKLSGKPASQWISDAMLTVAKVLLRKPGVTVQEVALELHFADQSSFGKFFKKHTGISPLEYKNNS